MVAPSRPFPSLVIGADGFLAHGSFAENQRTYLQPDEEVVDRLDAALERASAGVVAHFYMDAELQGVLTRCRWPHVHISDSLLMADRAVAMATAGVRAIVVLGVDFMAENVRAMLDASGFLDVDVYRAVPEPIGCSLAESAESRHYRAYLEQARATANSLHVVYINTSLRTKAWAHHLVPTITCTSSNVVATVLSAFAQRPNLNVWFGPDTYMGANLVALFRRLASLDDASVGSLHTEHSVNSIAELLPRFHYFRQGTCLVHHMFGAQVVRRVQIEHADAHIVAHLEVPGEMFALGLAAQMRGHGVVGSTSDILNYIRGAVGDACAKPGASRLPFVLGTESGMVTSIVRAVRQQLHDSGRRDIEAEIVFPVSDDAVWPTGDELVPVVPGVGRGEGCSVAGGCASCPYMKQNTLDAVFRVLAGVNASRNLLQHRPRVYDETIAGHSVAEFGTRPILFMREFQRTGLLPHALLERAAASRALLAPV